MPWNPDVRDLTKQITCNILLPENIGTTMANELTTAARRAKKAEHKATTLLKRIDQHFARAPFRVFRVHSQTWTRENVHMLKMVTDFARSVGMTFEPDEHGHLSPECFKAEVRERIAAAARAVDDSGGRRASSHQKSWVKLCRATDKYFASSVNGDVTNDPESRRVVQRFLKSLLDERDKDLQMINLLDKYLDDIAAVGEINDIFGKFPNQPKPLPFAYSNAWWVFDEVTLDAAFRYDIFMAEAEEIGYKRGKGNRYQLRPNDLFRCDDPNDLLNTIHSDESSTILARLRAHVREKKPSESHTLHDGFLTNAHNIAGQVFLRPDPKYRFFWDFLKGDPLHVGDASVCLRDITVPCVKAFIPKGELNEPREIVELDLVEPRTSIYVTDSGDFETVEEIGGPKLRFGSCTFVFPNLRPYLGKIVLNEPERDLIGSNKWIPVRLKESLVDSLFLKYLLLTSSFLQTYGCLCWGKSMPQMSERDLFRIRFPLPSLDRQRKAATEISKLERQLIEKHRSLTSRTEVIDAIFARELGYTLDDYKASSDRPIHAENIHEFSQSFDLRGGVRFHNTKFDLLDSVLSKIERCRFRDAVNKPLLRLGATVDPDKHYDDDGQAYYISPVVIRTCTFNLEAARTVTDQYYEENVRFSGLRENDVVIARSGEGTIGKSALYTAEEQCIHGDFTMRIRFNNRINPEFGYYFCCSTLFQFQVERNKRGMGNMTNFFPSQLLTFWIACPSIKRQEQIAEQVRGAVATFEAEQAQVRQLRDEIDSAVLQSIKAS